MLTQILSDVAQARRTLAKAPMLTVVASGSLGLFIAATVTVFSVLNATLLKPRAVRDPHGLYWMSIDGRSPGEGTRSSYAAYRQLVSSRVLGDVAAEDVTEALVTTHSLTESRFIAHVSINYFETLGVTLARGRSFSQSDRDREIVLSYSAWQSQFAGDSAILGKSVTVDDVSRQVIAIAPRTFVGMAGPSVSGWVPAEESAASDHPWSESAPRFVLFARLPTSTDVTVMHDRLKSLARSLAESDPIEWRTADRQARTIRLVPDRQVRWNLSDAGAIVAAFVVLAIVGLVLTCTNVAGLMYSRYIARRHEIAVRVAVGASRVRLFQQLAAESVLLTCVATAAGWIGTLWLLQWVSSWSSSELTPDWRVAIVATSAPVACFAIFGLMPLFEAVRSDPRAYLFGSTISPGSKLRSRLITLQIAVSFSVLAVSITSLRGVQTQLEDGGYNMKTLLLGNLGQPSTGQTSDALRAMNQARAEIGGVVGVRTASVLQYPPLANVTTAISFTFPDGNRRFVEAFYADSSYFSTIGIQPVTGRNFDRHDRRGSELVAVVNQTFARSALSDPVGKVMTGPQGAVRIIGVVPDVKYRANVMERRPFVYLLRDQYDKIRDASWYMLIRVEAGESESMRANVLAILRKRAPAAVRPSVFSMSEFLAAEAAEQTRISYTALGFAAVQLCLALMGWYAITKSALIARTREIGLRLALGASPAMAAWSALRGVAKYAILGVVWGSIVGVPAIIACNRFGIGAGIADPLPFALSAALVIVALALGGVLPARRIVEFDPAAALRHRDGV